MLVLCAGVQRSGSTWLYNAVRLSLPDCNAAWIDDWKPRKGVHNVVKLHSMNQELASRADVILTCRRDLRDVAASCIPRWVPEEKIIDPYLINWVKRHAWWKARTHCEVEYQRIISEPNYVVEEIQKALGLPFAPHIAAAVAITVDSLQEPAEVGYDKANLMWKGHRQDGRVGYYKEALKPGLVERLNTRFADWLKKYGYTE